MSVTPYASVTGFAARGVDYRLSNGMGVSTGTTRSLRGEVRVSHTFSLAGSTVEPWLKAGVRHETVGSNAVNINHDGHFKNELSGTRGVYEVGVRARLSENVTAQVSAGYGQGAGVESPWQAGAGISWSF